MLARRRPDPILAGAILAAVAARLAHWLLADRVWEDALITLAHVRNAVDGVGLTHHPGEGLVHGFTSALSVLVPLAGEALVQGSGLFVLRVASLAASVASVSCGYLIAQHLGAGRWGLLFVVSYLALDQLQIFFGMAGMETQIATAVLLAGTLAVLRGHVRTAGLLAGLGLLARPDFAIWVLLVVGWALLRGVRPGLMAAGSALVMAAPWVVFAALYYGSPIPQTIIAKSLVWSTVPGLSDGVGAWVQWIGQHGPHAALAVLAAFIPFYEDGVTLAAPIPASVLSLVGIALIALAVRGAWLTSRVPGWWPSLAYLAMFAIYWMALLPLGYFMWYQPPFLALTSILVGVAIGRLEIRSRPLAGAVAVALSLAVAHHLPWSIALDAKTQAEVERAVRQPTGEYLGEVVTAGQAVTVEAAGYLGYYSGAEMWDYPGLTSPTALEAVRSLSRTDRNLANAIAILRPTWLALRPREVADLEEAHPDVAACYVKVRTFGTPGPDIVSITGLARWNQDHIYTILRRAGTCEP